MISKKMMAAVEARGWFYILGARLRRTKEVRDVVLSDTGAFDTVEVARQRPDPMELQVKEVTVNDTPCKGGVKAPHKPRRYSKSLSIGSIAGAGSFAAMIPPSITMVIYAIMTEQSVGQLLIAGVIPGVLTAAVYLAGVYVLVRLNPSLAPPIKEQVSPRERWRAAGAVWPIGVLMALVLGGIYTGLFPPSAAGAAGAFGAFCLSVARKRGVRGWLVPTLQDAASISCIIFVILIGGLLLSRMLAVVGVIDDMVAQITALADTPLKFMILASVLYVVLGCFLDTTSMMVVTLPFLYPVTVALGIDPIWFGIVLVKLIEISVITPPVGINLFAVMSAVGNQATFKHVYLGVVPFIVFDLLVLGLLIAFPEIATWLPQRMIE